MERLLILVLSAWVSLSLFYPTEADTVLSAVLTPKDDAKLSRTSRSYYDPRYGTGQPYDRLEYDRPSRCGRCQDDRDDDYDRRRDRYDEDRRLSHRPTYGNNNRFDRNKGDNTNEDDKRYSTDRSNVKKNGTEDETDKDKNQYDDKDRRPAAGRRDRDRDRSRYDDRDRYRPDYYDRFLGEKSGRDRYERDRYDRDRYDRPYYDDPYRERRPLYDRYDDGYSGRYYDVYGRYDGYGNAGYRRPAYDDKYDRIGGDPYGGYGPGVGRGPHDRPWDETYRGQSGWDAGGRGYYFALGRPDAAPATGWTRPEYARPTYSESGWQNVGYRDPIDYRGSLGYDNTGYRQDLSAGYGQASGWRDVGERRPYRDQSGIPQVDHRDGYYQPTRHQSYGQASRQPSTYGQDNRQQSAYGQDNRQQTAYGQDSRQPTTYGQDNRPQSAYSQDNNQPSLYGQGNRQPSAYGQAYGQPANSASYTSSSTTPNTNYLFEREDERVPSKSTDETTKSSTS